VRADEVDVHAVGVAVGGAEASEDLDEEAQGGEF
jgi:hypothetical protein